MFRPFYTNPRIPKGTVVRYQDRYVYTVDSDSMTMSVVRNMEDNSLISWRAPVSAYRVIHVMLNNMMIIGGRTVEENVIGRMVFDVENNVLSIETENPDSSPQSLSPEGERSIVQITSIPLDDFFMSFGIINQNNTISVNSLRRWTNYFIGNIHSLVRY